jgi:hypothetical protein
MHWQFELSNSIAVPKHKRSTNFIMIDRFNVADSFFYTVDANTRCWILVNLHAKHEEFFASKQDWIAALSKLNLDTSLKYDVVECYSRFAAGENMPWFPLATQ